MIRVLGLVAVAVLVLAARATISGRQELARGAEFERAGDILGAIAHYRRAAKWYVPGTQHGAEAIQRLETIAEESGPHARAAWQAVHAAALGARSFYSPYADARTRADAALGAGDESAQLERALEDAHTADTRFMLAVALFWLFVGSAFAFAFRAPSKGDRLRPVLGATTALAFVGWLVALAG